MELAVVIGPYRAATDWQVRGNIEAAAQAAAWGWQQGYAVICPHLNTAHFSGLTDERAFLDGGLEMVRRADTVIALPNWDLSDGARAEMILARRLQKRVIMYGARTDHEGAL